MSRAVTTFIARDVSQSQADKLLELTHFSVGCPFFLGSHLDPTFRLDVYPLRSSEIVELAGSILARALEKGGGG